MATEAQLLANAAQAARLTTITWDEFLHRVATQPGYLKAAQKTAQWYRGGAALQAVHDLGAPPPPPPPPPVPTTSLASLAQRVLFTAWNPQAGLKAPPSYKLAITADWYCAVSPDAPAAERELAKANWITQAKLAAQQQHQRGGLVAVWGNQSQIPAAQLHEVAALVQAHYLIHQAENAAEYRTAMAAGAQVIVGNPNAWDSAQVTEYTKLAYAGSHALIFEVYTNEGGPWPDVASAAGVPAASYAPGVGWGATPYQLPDYKPHTPSGAWPLISPYLAEDFTSASWDALPG